MSTMNKMGIRKIVIGLILLGSILLFVIPTYWVWGPEEISEEWQPIYLTEDSDLMTFVLPFICLYIITLFIRNKIARRIMKSITLISSGLIFLYGIAMSAAAQDFSSGYGSLILVSFLPLLVIQYYFERGGTNRPTNLK